jgi:hypothetical protein
MKAKEYLVTGIALAAIALVAVLAYRHETRPSADLCRVCQRGLHTGLVYRLEMMNGTSEEACCPRCGMHFALNHPGTVRQAWATDFASGARILAPSAYYVEGGDEEYCTMHNQPVARGPQGVSVLAYDRCLPTLVAFRGEQDAEVYRRRHGGRVVTYDAALKDVRTP